METLDKTWNSNSKHSNTQNRQNNISRMKIFAQIGTIFIAIYLSYSYLTLTYFNIPIDSHMLTKLVKSVGNILFVRNHYLKSSHYFSSKSSLKMVRHLGQAEAIKIDEELFGEYKFSVDQLMELAGLSVATTIEHLYLNFKNKKVLVIAGPGNNGGDGIVAARHLKLFGFSNVSLLNGKKPTKDLYLNLLHQAKANDVEISYDPTKFKNDESIGLIVDGLFGFSFKPPVRPDFEPLMNILITSKVPIVSIDIPSGWDVEKGPREEFHFMPETLISLTAPKACAKSFTGLHHYLGGRFVPPSLALKYNLNLPQYPGTECIVKL